MLLDIKVHFPFIEGDIRLEQVTHILARNLIAFFLQDGLDPFSKKVAVRSLGFTEGQFLLIRGLFLIAAAACGQTGKDKDGKGCTQRFFHFVRFMMILPIMILDLKAKMVATVG